MLAFVLMLLSYGAFLLILMPATSAGLTSSAAMLVAGTAFMLYKRLRGASLPLRGRYYFLPVSALLAAYFGVTFYERWINSSRLKALFGALHLPLPGLLAALSAVLALLCAYFIYAVLHSSAELKLGDSLVGCLALCGGASLMTVLLVQLMSSCELLSMGWFRLFWCVLTVAVPVTVLYCLLGRLTLSVLLGGGIFMLIGTVNAYVCRFRGRLLEPVDIFSAGTAVNVASNYRLFPLPRYVATAWVIFLAAAVLIHLTHRRERPVMNAKRRVLVLSLCAVASASVLFYASSLKTYHWSLEGAAYNGYVLDLVTKLREISPSRPDSYSTELVDSIAEEYKAADVTDADGRVPHIIVIMDEAFSDLGVVGELSCNTEPTPFISSLRENTISGYALASVHGGNTANSEYEFLTGNSLAWLSPYCVPYQQYIRSSAYSMVSYLKLYYSYKCIAMHPFASSGWNRPSVYEHFGFDEWRFLEAFPQEELVRNYVSDREMFECLTDAYEAGKSAGPLFLFGVTMQNHGGYNYAGDNYTKHISLEKYGDSFPEAEQYLSLIHETDMAVEYLISYFQSVDEDVLIVFFGDHQPNIGDGFYNAVGGNTGATLEEKQNRYKVPFFIWANYGIAEEYIECTSLNYLSSYVYDAAGLELPIYNRFLRETERYIPAINTNGFYSQSEGRFLTFEEAESEEKRRLELYEALQYNSIFDKKNRNELLFPTIQ